MSNLDIPNPSTYFREEKFHSFSAIMKHFEKDQSVTNISNKNFESTFSFKKKKIPEEVVKVIRNLNIRKSCQTTDIPTKVIKLNSYILYTNTSTTVFDRGEFLNELKHAGSVQKKNCKRDKGNYGPASILLYLSKVYENILYSQLHNYFENLLFPGQYGFRKG